MINSKEIQKGQNERKMLEIQFAAREKFNCAESLYLLSWGICIISFLCAVFPSAVHWTISLGIPFFLDLLVIITGVIAQKQVQNAAELRGFFDSKVLGMNSDHFSDMQIKSIRKMADDVVQKKNGKAQIQMNNSGTDNPPGVKDWYVFPEALTGREAQFECQKQNVFWTKNMQAKRNILLGIASLVLVSVFVALSFINGFLRTLLCSAGLVGMIISRGICYWKCCREMTIIDGLVEALETKLSEQVICKLQEHIKKRRQLEVTELNFFYKKNAKRLTEITQTSFEKNKC